DQFGPALHVALEQRLGLGRRQGEQPAAGLGKQRGHLSARTLASSARSRASVGAGTAAGANRPNQLSISSAATPVSATLGTSGCMGWRSAEETAKARTLPASTCARAVEEISKKRSTRPPSTSWEAACPPR